jgi:hypothetical protein
MQEVEAHLQEALFVLALNKEETNSLYARINTFDANDYPLIQNTKFIIHQMEEAENQCGDDEKCYSKTLVERMLEEVFTSPHYEKQCGGELNNGAQ